MPSLDSMTLEHNAALAKSKTKMKGKGSVSEKTPAQVIIDAYDGTLRQSNSATTLTFEKARKMRLDPTISLARDMAVAPILFSSWSVEGDNDEAVEYLKEVMIPLRNFLMRTALYGEIDFGWKGYEVIYKIGDLEESGQRFYPRKIKPLLNENTYQRRNKYGEYIGLLHEGVERGERIFIHEKYSLFINFDDEGLGNYGEPTLARAENAYDQWEIVNEAANRYDEKIAGAHWIVYYPEGKTHYDGLSDAQADANGRVDNSLIASDILTALRSSGSISIPSSVSDIQNALEDISSGSWKIELLDSASKAADFVTRQKYLDSLKVRALGVLERAALEGQFGTKAEAETHSDTTLMLQQLKHQDITDIINVGLVQFLLEVNFADPKGAKLMAMPLMDERLDVFKMILEKLLSFPDTMPLAIDAIDIDEVFQVLDIPRDSQGDLGIGDMLKEITEKRNEQGAEEAARGPVGIGGGGARPEVKENKTGNITTPTQIRKPTRQQNDTTLSEAQVLSRFKDAAASIADGDMTLADVQGLGYSQIEQDKLMSFAESVT